jgi:hypothetical protein
VPDGAALRDARLTRVMKRARMERSSGEIGGWAEGCTGVFLCFERWKRGCQSTMKELDVARRRATRRVRAAKRARIDRSSVDTRCRAEVVFVVVFIVGGLVIGVDGSQQHERARAEGPAGRSAGACGEANQDGSFFDRHGRIGLDRDAVHLRVSLYEAMT